MPQLYFYVPDDVSERVRREARRRKMSVSRYLAEVVKTEVGVGWPKGYFDEVCGKWEGEFPEIARPRPEEEEGALL